MYSLQLSLVRIYWTLHSHVFANNIYLRNNTLSLLAKCAVCCFYLSIVCVGTFKIQN